MAGKAGPKLTIRLPEAIHRAAKAKAAEQGTTLEEVVRSFLVKWVEPERVARVQELIDKEEQR